MQNRDQLIKAWATQTTSSKSKRYNDLVRDKTNMVVDFFTYAAKPLQAVSAEDISNWKQNLAKRGLASLTVYSYFSKLRSFLKWCVNHPDVSGIKRNPALLVNAPQATAQQPERTDLHIKDILELIGSLKDHTERSMDALRDYPLFLTFLFTTLPRAEVLDLQRKNLRIERETVTIITQYDLAGIEHKISITNSLFRKAILDYLEEYDGAIERVSSESPLWTRFDKSGKPGDKSLSSQAFGKSLRQYMAALHLDGFRLEQMRNLFKELVRKEYNHDQIHLTSDLSEADLRPNAQY